MFCIKKYTVSIKQIPMHCNIVSHETEIWYSFCTKTLHDQITHDNFENRLVFYPLVPCQPLLDIKYLPTRLTPNREACNEFSPLSLPCIQPCL